MADKRMLATVRGRVQGVGFRYFTLNRAQKLGLKGWCRNTVEGHVEVDVVGTEVQLKEFLTYLQKGPVLARVNDVVYNIIDAGDTTYVSFDIVG